VTLVKKTGSLMRVRKVIPLLLLALAACSRAPENPRNTDWSILGNGPDAQYHSDLTAINKDNVGDLGLAWSVEIPSNSGLVGNPLIKNGVVFQSGPGGEIFANNLADGKALWHFAADYPEKSTDSQALAAFMARQTNRGLALYKDIAIVATGDCRLIAVDQKTGKKRWEAQSCDATQQYGITAAPRVGGGMVFTGNACFDSAATRGYVDAFDAETGMHKWRFYTVPGDPATEKDPFYRKLAKSWGTGWYARSHGCGSVWDAMVYDEKLQQLVIGTGAPSPGDPTTRAPDAGDELFTDSVVALDARTGRYKWHAKQVPHDGWNYEAAVGLMVADLPIGGQTRHVVVSVPKQGFSYVYDAATGKFLKGTKYVDMNWASGLDRNGRPIELPNARYWEHPGKDTIVLPSPAGAHGWEALSLNPKTATVYVPAMVMPVTMKTKPGAVVSGVSIDWHFGDRAGSPAKTHGEVVAIDLVANKVKWRTITSRLPMNGGLLHTAGGLVFQGLADGRLVAFDEDTGKTVWSRQTGGAIRAAPSTVMLNGEQYLVVATGNGASASTASIRYASTAESRTPSRLLAFKIGGKAPYPSLAHPEPIAAPTAPRQDAGLAKIGEAAFEDVGCDVCHGMQGGASAEGNVPNLNRTPPASLDVFKQIVQGGALRAGGMPQFKHVSDADAKALYAYIINEAWKAHDREQVRQNR